MSLPLHGKISEKVGVDRNLSRESIGEMADITSELDTEMNIIVQGLGATKQPGQSR